MQMSRDARDEQRLTLSAILLQRKIEIREEF